MVRLVGEGVEPNIYPLREALRIVEELGVDLVEIQPDANPPVCKAMDYKKFVFDQKKRLKEQKAKATKVVIKEIRLGPQAPEGTEGQGHQGRHQGNPSRTPDRRPRLRVQAEPRQAFPAGRLQGEGGGLFQRPFHRLQGTG